MRGKGRLVERLGQAALPGATQFIGVEEIRVARQRRFECEFRQGIGAQPVAGCKKPDEIDIRGPNALVRSHRAGSKRCTEIVRQRAIADDHQPPILVELSRKGSSM